MLESGSIVAGNSNIHKAVLELLAEAKEATPV
jgi:hypothetical protein